MAASEPQSISAPLAAATPATWSYRSRIAFRFCSVYFTLYVLTTQILAGLLPIYGVDIPDLASLWPLRPVVFWAAAHIFHITSPLVYTGSGSGDKTFDWVLTFCLLVTAIFSTAVWSILDRRRTNYATLYKWFRVFLRFALAGQMFLYGVDKAVPLQMPFPSLARLLTSYGNFSPMGVLWSSIGASPSYEIFAGCAEILGGVLLIIPRTAMLGALICLVDMIQVFMLNMTYDVPVKLFSFHLVLIIMILLAPDFARLTNFLLLNRATSVGTLPPLFTTRHANRIAVAAQVIFGISLLGVNIAQSQGAWKKYGGGRANSPLYGIWSVDKMAVDGRLRSPLVTDYERWRNAIFDYPDRMSFQRMDGSFANFRASIDVAHKTIELTKNNDSKWKTRFIFQRMRPDELALQGSMDSHKIEMELKLEERNKFLLVNRGFHWIQEYPFNR